MIAPADLERLHQCVRRESRSLLQYVREVPLWAARADHQRLERMRELAQKEHRTTNALAGWLQKQRAGLLHVGPYPAVFLTLNDASLSHLLPQIVRDHAAGLAALENDAAAIGDSGARAYLERMAAIKRQNQPELAALGEPMAAACS